MLCFLATVERANEIRTAATAGEVEEIVHSIDSARQQMNQLSQAVKLAGRDLEKENKSYNLELQRKRQTAMQKEIEVENATREKEEEDAKKKLSKARVAKVLALDFGAAGHEEIKTFADDEEWVKSLQSPDGKLDRPVCIKKSPTLEALMKVRAVEETIQLWLTEFPKNICDEQVTAPLDRTRGLKEICTAAEVILPENFASIPGFRR